MAETLIETKAPSEVTTPTAGYVEFFYDSTNNLVLSYMSSDRLVHVLGDSDDDDCCACDISKEFWCNVAGMVKKGFMSASQFQTLVNTGFNATSSEVTDNLGNKTCVVNSGAILIPVISVTITPDPVTNLDISSSPTSDLTAAVLPVTANQGIIWVSSDTSKVTVSQIGLITGIAAGTAIIYAYSIVDPTKFDSVSVTVVP